jgi:hypothetical protein
MQISVWYCIHSGTVLKQLCNEHLFLKKVCTWKITNIVILNEGGCVAVSAKHLYKFEMQGNTFLDHGVICDEMWMHYFTQESKWSSMG